MCAHTLPIPLLLYPLNIFGVGEFSTGSVNLLFTSINKIRYKLLQYKLPCSGPPLTSAINDEEPPFSQLQETPGSRTKFQPANVLTKSPRGFFQGPCYSYTTRGRGARGCGAGADAAVPTLAGYTRHLELVRLVAFARISRNQEMSYVYFCQRAWVEQCALLPRFRLTDS